MANSGDSPITLEVVTERAQWRQFLALPHRLYATDPAWIAPLDFEQRQRFSPANHFFDHARWRAWLALRGGVVVGRITAQIDEMHLRQHAEGGPTMITHGIAMVLHILSAVLWVGGMFFAYMALRPAAATVLEPPLRLQLWVQAFKLFFVWVWLSIIVILVTGYWMLFAVFGGFGNAGLHIHIMHGAGILMVLIYLHVFDWPEGGELRVPVPDGTPVI